MSSSYIARTLIANLEHREQRRLNEFDIPAIEGPIVILGDPGSGKTELTKFLERNFQYARVAGGTFYRSQDIDRFRPSAKSRLIIDGLDEIASSSGTSAIDEVLKKLSQIGNPSFILSCRSADWQGSTDRHKISSDYGIEPTTLLIQPFSYDEARTFLVGYEIKIDPDHVLNGLIAHDLRDFYANPLTLTLVAEIAAAGQGLPSGRIDLLNRATELLTFEKNPAHQKSQAALVGLTDLLDSAGAIFAHLLLSGSTGIANRSRENVVDGFVAIGDFNRIRNAPHISAAIKTRLFQSPDEGLYIPFHRVVAEYLGATWLSKQISNGLSERRVFQALTFAGGVPTSLRGIHAWIAHFSPRLAPRCIETDPYGVLRYGEPDGLPLDQAHLLLTSLASLADEDPYFRSEDWGKRAITGLARPELRDDIVALIKNPDRHTHLSTLVLEALDGSQLTNIIAPELMAIVENSKAVYAERVNAVEALIGSDVDINWPKVAAGLTEKTGLSDKRLVLEIIALTSGAGFTPFQISSAILDYKTPARHRAEEAASHDGDDDEPYVSGMVRSITRKISPAQSAEVLDEISSHIQKLNRPAHWRAGYELTTTIRELVEKAIQNDQVPSPVRMWTWLKLIEGEIGYSRAQTQPIQDWILRNPELRREIQWIAFKNVRIGDGPWMAIVHDLPTANLGLALTATDVTELLNEIGSKDNVTNFDVELWSDLVRSRQIADGISAEVKSAVDFGTQRHSSLNGQWKKLIAPPTRDWRKEEEDRRADRESKQARKFAKHRASFWPNRGLIASGEDIGALHQIAKAYLGRYSDLDNDVEPDVRVRQWLGDEVTSAAFAGFVAYLSRNDIPSARKIAETQDGKEWNVEPILVCAIVEMVRTNKSLATVSVNTASAALAAWWEYSDFNSNRLGDETQRQLEDHVFSSEQSIEHFLSSVMEPGIGAGQQHVPGLYRIANEDRFAFGRGKMVLRWLADYPNASASVQLELLRIAAEHSSSQDVQLLIRKRLTEIHNADIELQRAWMAAAFQVDFLNCKETLVKFFGSDRVHLWSLQQIVGSNKFERSATGQRSVSQLEFIVLTFADKWPPVHHPSSSWGDTHPWNATEFIISCINAIGAVPTQEATTSLENMISVSSTAAYSDHLKHTRAQQLRLRRDTDFRISGFNEVKQALSNGLPAGIDDLKAMVLDRLEIIQDYLRNGDTDAWEAFWINDNPKDENTSRDRLLDQLRPRFPVEINFLPEVTVPEANRADIVVTYLGYGLPIEIKGQWHAKVWNAASVQLIEKYARDWRADDRGIYLVLWFGEVAGKKLPKHPNALPSPSSPRELRQMLVDGLSAADRARIDVFVLDVSKPSGR